MTSEQSKERIPSNRWFQLRRLWSTIVVLLLAASLDATGVSAAPSEEGDVGTTPPRLSLVVGDVTFWRPGTENWVAAQLNTPLAPGDALYTGPGARAEVQIGGRAFVRLGDGTQFTVVNQEPDFVQMQVTSGIAALDLRELSSARTVQLDTPNAAVTIEDPGYYRVDVREDATTLITRRGGRARVRIAGTQPTDIGPNDRMVIEGSEAPTLAVYNAPALDDWDRWNYDRTDHVLASESSRYLPRDVYGAETLDDYGTWRVEPTYGRVWVPSSVSPGWAPYSTGEWVWDTYYGWSWVDVAPWGWAPFHYGRWVYFRNCWGWAPGPIVVRPVYAPALVAFFGGPGFRVGIATPFVSWVALGWGEPIVPWWGRPGFIGVPCWRGWGGPRVVNNIFVNKTIVNVHHPTTFANTRVHDAVVTVPRDRFGRWPVERLRTTSPSPTTLRPLGGELPVKPTSLSGPRTAPGLPHGGGRVTRGGSDTPRRPSSANVQHPSQTGAARREPPLPRARVGRSETDTREPRRVPAPPQAGAARRVGPGYSGDAADSVLPRRPSAPPPVREAARDVPQGSFSAPQQPQPPRVPRVEQPRPPVAPAPMGAPSVGSAPAAPRGSFRGPSMVRPHAAPVAPAADAPPAGAPAAPAAAPHSPAGMAPASRGHAVHAR